MKLRILLAFFAGLFLLGGAAAQEDETVVLITHDSFAISEATLAAFEAEQGLKVEVLRAGDAGQMVNQAILSKGNTLGDILYGIDNSFLSRALAAEIFLPYESPALGAVQEIFLPAPPYYVSPIDFGDVCLNYDIAYFQEHALALPSSLQSLTQAEYAGLLVVQNPATSSPGLAFLLATIAEFGVEAPYSYLDFWAELAANDLLIADGWTDAYYGEFTVGSRGSGDRPLVVSYASSPPAEVLYGEDPEAGAVTGAIVDDNMCFRQVEYAGVLAGARNEAGAKALLDFMLSPAFQQDMPLNMFVFPVLKDLTLPDIFLEYAQIPEKPATVAPAEIEAKRDEWIQAWVEVMLR